MLRRYVPSAAKHIRLRWRLDIEGMVLDVMNVGGLRALERLPQPIRVRIAYRLLPNSRVHVSPAD